MRINNDTRTPNGGRGGGVKDLCEIIKSVNDNMKAFGFKEKISIGNDNVEINEKEVIIKMPYELTLKFPKESFKEDSSIKEAVSKAISQAVSHPVSVNK